MKNKSINVVVYINRIKEAMVNQTDGEKSFHKIQHFTIKTLCKLGKKCYMVNDIDEKPTNHTHQ